MKIKVIVLTKHNTKGILKAYCLFCEEFDRNRALYGRTAEAVEKTIGCCLDSEEMAPMWKYLKENEAEVIRIMSDIELQNRLIEMRIKEEGEAMKVQGIAEGRAVGIAEGKAEGKAEGIAVGEAKNKVEMLKSYRKYLKSTGFSEETQNMLYNGYVASIG